MKTGYKAKNFSLKDQNGKELSLLQFRGKKVLLSFHPLAWTEVCAKQMQSLEEHKQEFDALKTVALGISVDTVPSKKAWAEYLKIEKTQLLSDFWPHGEVSRIYDNFIEKFGFSGRANIIVDEVGEVIFAKRYKIKELPDIKEVIEFLKSW